MTARPARAGWGTWHRDGEGRPSFVLDTAGRSDDVWHLVGSPGLLALAHGSGLTSLYATGSGVSRLARHSGHWMVDGVAAESPSCTYGCGWAEWRAEISGVAVTRRIEADPDTAVLRVRWCVETDRPVRLSEAWHIDHVPMIVGALMSRSVPVPSTHRGLARAVWRLIYSVTGASRALTDRLRAAVGRRYPLRHDSTTPGTSRWSPRRRRDPPSGPRWFRRDLPSLVLTCHGPHRTTSTPDGLDIDVVGDPDGAAVVVELTLRLESPPIAAGDLRATTGIVSSPDVEVEIGGAEQLAVEAVWHLHQLRSLRVPDAFTGHTFVMQGSAYAFVHGLHGAPRDSAFVVVPLSILDPPTARETMLTMGSMTRADGTLHYAHTGHGRVVSAIHAAPTDLPLFFLWALSEFVWATGDHSILRERPHPMGRRLRPGETAPSMEELAVAASRAIRERVGTGPHGMLRVGSGDWADPISLMVRRRRDFHRLGESGFNTAMATYVLPRAATLLDDVEPGEAARARQLAADLDGALAEAWTGRWFLRGWDGRGAPIGADHCFLDGQVWPLIARHGDPTRRSELVTTMGALLDDPSPIGPTILDRPHDVRLGLLADGWDCNGGVWAALGGLAAWAYSLHDPERAWRTLRRQSFAAHAEAYPDTWYGQWSGPDAYNAWFGDRPGETFVQPATPMTEFPVMNSNAHAGPLLGLVRALGLTVGPGGLTVDAGNNETEGEAWRLRVGARELTGQFGGCGRPLSSSPERTS